MKLSNKNLRICLLVFCALVSACSNSSASDEPKTSAGPEGPVVRLPSLAGPDSLMLYNRYSQALTSFNVSTKNVEEVSNETNYFQYEFPTPSDLFLSLIHI